MFRLENAKLCSLHNCMDVISQHALCYIFLIGQAAVFLRSFWFFRPFQMCDFRYLKWIGISKDSGDLQAAFSVYDLTICVSSFSLRNRPALFGSERPNFAVCSTGWMPFCKMHCAIFFAVGRAAVFIYFFHFICRFLIFKSSMFDFLNVYELS